MIEQLKDLATLQEVFADAVASESERIFRRIGGVADHPKIEAEARRVVAQRFRAVLDRREEARADVGHNHPVHPDERTP